MRYLWLIMTILCIINADIVNADELHHLADVTLSENEQNSCITALGIAKTENEVIDVPICCFDVCYNGYIAVGLDNNAINIYDNNGNYVYGYTFNTSGKYLISWQGDIIVIYLFREQRNIYIYDKTIKAKKVIDIPTADNPIIQYMNATEKKMNTKKYILYKNVAPFDVIAVGYGTLKAKNNYSGTEYIILDVSLSYKYSLLIKCVFIVILITIVIIVLKKQFGHTGDREL